MVYCAGMMLGVKSKMQETATKIHHAIRGESRGTAVLGLHTFGELGLLPTGRNTHGNLMFSCVVFSNRAVPACRKFRSLCDNTVITQGEFMRQTKKEFTEVVYYVHLETGVNHSGHVRLVIAVGESAADRMIAQDKSSRSRSTRPTAALSTEKV